MQEGEIIKILETVDCKLLKKCNHIAINGIKVLANKGDAKKALSSLCTGCGVKSENLCPGKQEQINQILESVMS